jgi:hypothetical protein
VADREAKKSAPAPAKPNGGIPSTAKINATIRKAESGDAKALADIREMLKQPGIADLFRGDVAKEAMRTLLDAYARQNPVIRAAAGRKMEEMRAELSGPNPTALEKLLVSRVLATWLHLHHLEAAYASKESLSLSLGLYYQKAITAAQKRYLAAIKGLAEVRKLALPTLQVNIAKKQINVAAAAVTPAG